MKCIVPAMQHGCRVKALFPRLKPDCISNIKNQFFGETFTCFPFRHMLASLHLNENLLRETKKTEDGKDYYKVTYPKFKLGEEVVREIAVPPTYGKVLCM